MLAEAGTPPPRQRGRTMSASTKHRKSKSLGSRSCPKKVECWTYRKLDNRKPLSDELRQQVVKKVQCHVGCVAERSDVGVAIVRNLEGRELQRSVIVFQMG